MDSVYEEDNNSVFGHNNNLHDKLSEPMSSESSRQRSPSLPVVASGGIARSRSPSLPAQAPSSTPVGAVAKRSYTDRSDSGISDCSNHSSGLLTSFSTPWLIQEEDESGSSDIPATALTNGSLHPAGGTTVGPQSGVVSVKK